MFYKVTISKDKPLNKQSIWASFHSLTQNIYNDQLAYLKNSLHCSYELNSSDYENKDVDFFFYEVDFHDLNKEYIDTFGFEVIKKLPEEAIHISGYYNGLVKRLFL